MPARLAMPVVGVVIGTRQQLAGARGLDHGDRAIRPGLGLLGVEWQKKVKAFTGVAVDRGEDRRRVGDIEVSLVQPNLRGIMRISFLESVTFERAPTPVAQALVFPKTRIADAG